MNQYQLDLYNSLLETAENNEAFFYRDFIHGMAYYRIFDYRLASYTDFQLPGATECRGAMFELDMMSKDVKRLASLPMSKFWNLNENPFTMNLDLSTVQFVEEKADGSLISSYVHWTNGNTVPILRLKSKGSIESTQCVDAMEFLHQRENWYLYWDIRQLTVRGFTVNLEWCSPTNRIVLGYDKPQLRVLNVRNNANGEYVKKNQLNDFPEVQKNWVSRLFDEEDVDQSSVVEFIDRIPDMKDIEGFVLHLASGQRVKVKTSWYLARHHVKDSINSPRRLFEAVLEEATDDMRTMFHTDSVAIQMIEEMEQKVGQIYNHTVDTVERFYERNKQSSRKEYAILGQQQLERKIFSLAMQKYLGKTVDYKQWMKKHYRDFGITDEVNVDE